MRFLKLISLILLLLFWKSVYSQPSKQIIIIGKIIDKVSSLSIANVNIIDTVSKKGVVSGKTGLFTLNTIKQPTSIKFSHVSYNSYTLTLGDKELNLLKITTLFF